MEEHRIQERKLGDYILDIAAGPFGSNLKVNCFVPDGFPIIDGANLKGFKVTDNVTKFVTETKARSLHRSIAKRNDVVVTISGTVGQISYIPEDSQYEEYLVSQRQFRVTFDENRVYVPYLVYYFHTKEGQHKILSFANQTGVPALAQPLKNFRNIDIALPEIETQRRISKILESLDKKIELNNRINQNLEGQVQERFDSMIMSDYGLGYCQIADYVDVNPQRRLGKNMPAKCIDMSYLSTTGPFPSGWETKDYNGGMKFLNGDTIMARITPCLENGKVAYVNFLGEDEVAFGSTEYIVLHSKEGVTPVFTYFLARNKGFVDYATKNMNGSSGRQRVSGETVGKYILPVIDSATIKEFSSFATPAMNIIRNNSFENRSLAATRDTLLPLLMSGELSTK